MLAMVQKITAQEIAGYKGHDPGIMITSLWCVRLDAAGIRAGGCCATDLGFQTEFEQDALN